MSDDKVILSCALTGAVTTKKHCPAIPYTPVEIAEEAKRAYDAGAAVVHIHARTDDGAPTFEPEVFARIKDEIRKMKFPRQSGTGSVQVSYPFTFSP